MKRIGTQRAYRSELREQQAAATRDRIVDAAVAVMARGIASLSIPAVAEEAGVSVPTVYRHFATKGDLLAAVYPHVARQAGLHDLRTPQRMEEMREAVRDYFGRLEGIGPEARAAMASPAAEEVRHLSIERRLAMWRAVVDSVQPPLHPDDRERLARVMSVLIASSSLRMWIDHLGASADVAADDIAWLLDAAVAASRRTEA